MYAKLFSGCVLVLALAGCGDSTTPVAGGTPTTQQRIKQELQTAGAEVKAAATQAAADMKPALQTAKEDTRQAVHTAAEKVADWTATQPAKQPQ